VLDLDETLVHCSTEVLESHHLSFPVDYNGELLTVYARLRPNLHDFLARAATVRTCVRVGRLCALIVCSPSSSSLCAPLRFQMFEVVLFTASQQAYANSIIDIIDPNRVIKSGRGLLLSHPCFIVPIPGCQAGSLHSCNSWEVCLGQWCLEVLVQHEEKQRMPAEC
jgi:hypothetical protein